MSQTYKGLYVVADSAFGEIKIQIHLNRSKRKNCPKFKQVVIIYIFIPGKQNPISNIKPIIIVNILYTSIVYKHNTRKPLKYFRHLITIVKSIITCLEEAERVRRFFPCTKFT